MQNEQMSVLPESNLSQAMMVARDLLAVACEYVDRWGEQCLNDPDTPSFIRSIFSGQGLAAARTAC
jgi:hypothetical protein